MVDRFSFRETGLLAIDGDEKAGAAGGRRVVDHEKVALMLRENDKILRLGRIRNEGFEAEGEFGFSDAGGSDVEDESFPKIDIEMSAGVQEVVLAQKDERGCEGGAFVAIVEGVVLAKMKEVGGGDFYGILDQGLTSEGCLGSGDGAFQKT